MLWLFLKYFRQKIGSYFFTLNKAKLCKNLIVTLVFEKNAYFCSPKIAEYCDHKIGPRVTICFIWNLAQNVGQTFLCHVLEVTFSFKRAAQNIWSTFIIFKQNCPK
jgi:hypothetical protein